MVRTLALSILLAVATLAQAQGPVFNSPPSQPGCRAGQACTGTTITATNAFRAADGSAATPSYSFTNDTNTGIFSGGAGYLSFAAGGTEWMRVTANSTMGNLQIEGTRGIGLIDTLGNTSDLRLTRYSPKQLMISGDGTGDSTNAGWVLGYGGSTGESVLVASTRRASAANDYTLKTDVNNDLLINAVGGRSVSFKFNGGSTVFNIPSTAGAGPSITAGTATTDVAALSITRTNNNAAVATGVKWTFTDTTSAAGFLPFQILCGSTGTTNCLSIGKTGNLFMGANTVSSSRMELLVGGNAAGSYIGLGVSGTIGSSIINDSGNNLALNAVTGAGIYHSINGVTVTALTSTGVAVTGGLSASGSAVVLSGLGASTGTPSSLCMNGTTVTVNAALTCTVSSERYKDDIYAFGGNALKMVTAIEPATFFYKDRLDRPRIGLIAEQLAGVDKRLAEWDGAGRANSIDFPALMALQIKALKEVDARLNRAGL